MKRSDDGAVAKGTRFEAKVYNYLRGFIEDGHFFAQSKCCRLFRQKGYASKERGADIKFDISIEIYNPGDSEYSLLVAVECKDYRSSVPVADVELLDSRMQQVSGGNTKGVIIATSALQSAAIGLARSKGIGVARWFSKSDVKWTLKRTPACWGFRAFNSVTAEEALLALTSETGSSWPYELYGLNDRGTNSIAELVVDAVHSHIGQDAFNLLAREPSDIDSIPYYSQDAIDEEVSSLLGRLDYRDGRVPLALILKQEHRRAGLEHEFRAATHEEQRRRTLGCFDLQARKISIINCEPHEADRQRFTIAHELGHHFLNHGDILERERCDLNDIDEWGVSSRISNQGLCRMEIQANTFASSLLLPKRQLMRDLKALAVALNLRDKGYGLIYLDDQPCNRSDHLRITHQLQVKYGASRSAITLRLKTVGVLTIAPPAPRETSPWRGAFR
jgi:Zn-dependent peptidase ImmA (M78 family)